MKTKTSVIISFLITTVLLTVLIGVISTVSRKNSAQSADATLVASYYSTREAQYQGLIAQANNSISQANQEILSLQGQNVDPTAALYPVSADQASAAAATAAGENALQTPTLVNYSGKVAYEVVFPDGKVYVDANTGSILYNGVLAAKTISSQQAALIASNYTGNSPVVEVVSGYYNNQAAYRVTFNNGEIVYMNVYGTVLAVQPAPASSSGGSEEDGHDD
jgi:hypothetical protein